MNRIAGGTSNQMETVISACACSSSARPVAGDGLGQPRPANEVELRKRVRQIVVPRRFRSFRNGL
jgi:hypothetical protein